MSAPKRRRSIVWYKAGTKHTKSWSTPRRGDSLALIPREPLHLVDAYCSQDHLTAVLVPNGAEPPLVMVHGNTVPVPRLALTSNGLVAVMVHDDDSGWQVGTLGTPRESFPVDCPTCWNIEHILDADALSATLAEGGRRLQLRRT